MTTNAPVSRTSLLLGLYITKVLGMAGDKKAAANAAAIVALETQIAERHGADLIVTREERGICGDLRG